MTSMAATMCACRRRSVGSQIQTPKSKCGEVRRATLLFTLADGLGQSATLRCPPSLLFQSLLYGSSAVT